MNSTTSLAFTSLSMNCSMPMDSNPFERRRHQFAASVRDICSADTRVTPSKMVVNQTVLGA
jgi:hypothetical protein